MFEPLPFEKMNETDVREDILAPLVKELGYSKGSIHDVIREQHLRYPRMFLGRKDTKKDPLLRGKADYILEANGKVRWVLEAKAPSVDINVDEIEQAWSYASHPEVRAVYFVLSNGKTLQIFQTNQGPKAMPLLSIIYAELDKKIANLKNILSPKALLRDHPEIKPDFGEPLGPGLRSFAMIANGVIKYESNTFGWPVLNELQSGIAGESIERDEDGKMVAYIRTVGPSRSLQELNERLGLSSFEMTSVDSSLSTNPEKPSTFIYDKTVILPKGENLLDLQTWKQVVLPNNISCRTVAKAKGFLEGHKFKGQFDSELYYLEAHIVVGLAGSFEMFLL